MKKSLLLSLLLMFFAQNNFAETIDEEQLRRKMLEQYTTITGGWYLQKKCDVLSRDEMREFEWHIFHIGQTMQQIASAEILNSIQKKTQSIIDSEEYGNCNDESKQLIHALVESSRQINLVLNDKVYARAVSDREYDFKRFSSVAAVMKINSDCPDFIDAEKKRNVRKVYESVQRILIEKYGILFNEFAIENDRKLQRNIECSDETKFFFMNGLGQLQALESDLRL